MSVVESKRGVIDFPGVGQRSIELGLCVEVEEEENDQSTVQNNNDDNQNNLRVTVVQGIGKGGAMSIKSRLQTSNHTARPAVAVIGLLVSLLVSGRSGWCNSSCLKLRNQHKREREEMGSTAIEWL